MRLPFSLLLLVASVCAAGRAEAIELWTEVAPPAKSERLAAQERWLRLDTAALRAALETAKRTGNVSLALPLADGGAVTFDLQPSAVMPAELAAKFPEIRTFRGVDIASATRVRVETVGDTIGAMFFTGDGVQLLMRDEKSGLYRSLDRESADAGPVFSCGVDAAQHAARDAARREEKALTAANEKVAGTQLRTYRTAIATTAEFTAKVGGTAAAAANVASAVNRLNEIFESELGLRLQLIPDNDLLFFTDPASDGYTNSDSGTMLLQNQNRLDALIGSVNYDLGHVFSTTGGGIAVLGAACRSALKGRGVSGTGFTPGELFWVDIVAHEIGHQFDAEHTFNSAVDFCGKSRDSGSAYEPGSGSTIMAYAGICFDGTIDEDLQFFADANFHGRSLEQIRSYSQSSAGGGSCGTLTPTGNTAPVVITTPGSTIPARTPFTLTANAIDADADTLTYSWEQFDLGMPSPPLTDGGNRPLFRTFPPTPSPSRSFPKLADILAGKGLPADFVRGEVLPTTTRTLTFRVVVRDGAGGVQWSGSAAPSTQLQVFDTGAGFAVTGLDAPESLIAGMPLTIGWNVAGTQAKPISCANVDIAWSTDNGASFATVLAAGTPNDGSHEVSIPAPATAQGRVRVSCASNIFFDINNAPLTLVVDDIPPLVVAVDTLDPSPALEAPLRFAVRFSEPVSGVDIDDFVIDATGTLADLRVESIAGHGATRIVTVDIGNLGMGSGTVGIDFVDDDSVRDAADNPVGSTGAGNGNFNAGENYSVTPAQFIRLFRNGFESAPSE